MFLMTCFEQLTMTGNMVSSNPGATAEFQRRKHNAVTEAVVESFHRLLAVSAIPSFFESFTKPLFLKKVQTVNDLLFWGCDLFFYFS